MAKLGSPYQQLVAEVLQVFQPNAVVSHGQWIKGPDGSLDLDVSIRGLINGKQQHFVIECKDFDVTKSGKVGRPLVDAFESKRRDIGADWVAMCSNSGFTADALRKCARVGIGAITLMRQGDRRVRAVVDDEVYVRKYTLTGAEVKLIGIGAARKWIEERQILGKAIEDWMIARIRQILFLEPRIDESFAACHRIDPRFTTGIYSEPSDKYRLDLLASLDITWTAREATWDSDNAVFNYLTQKIHQPMQDGLKHSISMTVDIANPRPVPHPPSFVNPGRMGSVVHPFIELEFFEHNLVSDMTDSERAEVNTRFCKADIDKPQLHKLDNYLRKWQLAQATPPAV